MTLSAHAPAPDVPDATAPSEWPDATGHYGVYGGRFVPEALVAALDDLTEAFEAMRVDPAFVEEFARHWGGDPLRAPPGP